MGTTLEPLRKVHSVLRSNQAVSQLAARAGFGSALPWPIHGSRTTCTARVLCKHRARRMTCCRATQRSTSPQPAPFAGVQERCRTADMPAFICFLQVSAQRSWPQMCLQPARAATVGAANPVHKEQKHYVWPKQQTTPHSQLALMQHSVNLSAEANAMNGG